MTQVHSNMFMKSNVEVNNFHLKKITYKKDFGRLMSLSDSEVASLSHN